MASSYAKKWVEQIPHIADKVFNRYIKQYCQKAGITDSVTIKEVVGGKEVKTTKEKWELVTSHTARRTGATLMYLSGMDVYDIIKITGHASPAILKTRLCWSSTIGTRKLIIFDTQERLLWRQKYRTRWN